MYDSCCSVSVMFRSQLNYNRHEYRKRRLRHYTADTNLGCPSDEARLNAHKPLYQDILYNYNKTYLHVKPCYYHFQLRHLCHTLNNNEIYTLGINYTVQSHNTLTNTSNAVVNFSASSSCTTSMNVDSKNQLLYCGSMNGELCVIDLTTGYKINKFDNITTSADSTTNGITTYYNNNEPHALISTNDCYVRDLNIESMSFVNEIKFDHPLNYATAQPYNNNIICCVGDSYDCYIYDTRCNDTVYKLIGHTDHTFSCTWHNNTYNICTASEDCTGKIWDIRRKQNNNVIYNNDTTDQSIYSIVSYMSPIRSCQYSSDSNTLVLAEAADFIHIYDANSNYDTVQNIDFFGEISGVNITDDNQMLYVAITDRIYGCLLQYNINQKKLLDIYSNTDML